jgi:hypothetical protein
MSEKQWLSEFDVIENLIHIKDGYNLTIEEYNKMPFLERCNYMCYYENTMPKKGLKNNKYFFEVNNFKFRPFLTYKHFVCVVKYGNTLEYFDSHGNTNKFYYKRLKKIAKFKGLKVVYNKKKLQTNNYSCGRYVILRCLMYFNDLKTFISILDENIKLYNLKDYDDVVDFILYKYYNIKF